MLFTKMVCVVVDLRNAVTSLINSLDEFFTFRLLSDKFTRIFERDFPPPDTTIATAEAMMLIAFAVFLRERTKYSRRAHLRHLLAAGNIKVPTLSNTSYCNCNNTTFDQDSARHRLG